MNFLKLIRWKNLLIIILIQYFTRYFIIAPFYKLQNISLQMGDLDFLLLVFAIVLLAAAGYIINDIFDLQIDRINKPDKLIVDNSISEKKANIIYVIMNTVAVLIGVYLGYKVGSINLGLSFLVCIAMFYFYSLKYKRLFLWGNFVIAFLGGFLLIIVWLFEFFAVRNNPLVFTEGLKIYWTISYFIFAYALFSFIITLIREFIKDIEDMEGDSKWGCTTLPVVVGVENTKKIAALLSFLSVAILAFFQMKLKDMDLGYFAGILMITVQLPFVFLGYKIWTAKAQEDYHFISNLTKIMMVIGILTMFGIYYNLQP
ncbi:MAG: geranylgeranylglycerol-phosphate geranylgeranyltransferase [Bacteroidetes bacterium]|nr:geranylgeranylglycerol-phosphate geranylgeranyltransferase [Bacteroidota bacterium]